MLLLDWNLHPFIFFFFFESSTDLFYIQNMACVVTNEDMCSFGYLSVVHHRMRQTSSIALNERLKQTKNFVHNLIFIISALNQIRH